MPYGPKPVEDTNLDNLVLCTKTCVTKLVDTTCRPSVLCQQFPGLNTYNVYPASE